MLSFPFPSLSLPSPPLPSFFFILLGSLSGYLIDLLRLQLPSVYRCQLLTPDYFSPKFQAPIFKHLPDNPLQVSMPVSMPENSLEINSFKIKILSTFHSSSLKLCSSWPSCPCLLHCWTSPHHQSQSQRLPRFLFLVHSFSCQSWRSCLFIVWPQLLTPLSGLSLSPPNWNFWTSFPPSIVYVNSKSIFFGA